MSKIYCQKCGSKNIYSLNAPKFCNACGEPFLPQSLRNTKKQTPREIKGSKISEDETDIFEVPHLNSLEVETSSEGNKTFNFNSIIGSEYKGE